MNEAQVEIPYNHSSETHLLNAAINLYLEKIMLYKSRDVLNANAKRQMMK